MHDIMVSVGIALGSNLPSGVGNSTETLSNAIERIRAAELGDIAVSRFYGTPAWPPGSGPEFVNAAAVLRTSTDPRTLLQVLHGIEADLGRTRRERWGPRVVDLDLLFHGDTVLPDLATCLEWVDLDPRDQVKLAPDQLILPHPRLQERGFVLVPLGDVAPHWRHPVFGKTVSEMIDALSPDQTDAIRVIDTASG